MELVQAVLAAPPALAPEPASIDLEVTGLLKVDAQSRIDAAGKGYAGGHGPGNSDWRGIAAGGVPWGDTGTGGSHGGSGGLRDEEHPDAQPVHGRFADPRAAGGGGSSAAGGERGGAGGGIIRIRAGEIELNGVKIPVMAKTSISIPYLCAQF